MKQQLLKRWIAVLCFFLIVLLMPALVQVMWQKTWLYFNFSAFFIAFIFWTIIFLAERQTPEKKIGYTLGGIGIKFILTIVAIIAYFVVFKEKTIAETFIAFLINGIYYLVGYFFLYRLSRVK